MKKNGIWTLGNSVTIDGTGYGTETLVGDIGINFIVGK
jgi:hypothetical protein